MKESFRYILLIGFLYCGFQSSAQVEEYEYRIPILQAKAGWNSIPLPSYIFSNVKKNLSDIRIYGIDPKGNKSIEQPYILDIQEAKNDKTEVEFKIINSTKSNGIYSYTFELSNTKSVDNIHLDFSNQNFDWSIHLEGSMNQNTWSTIVNNYRIVSLKNQNADFKYTDLAIPESKFNFYRISFNSSKKPHLNHAILAKEVNTNYSYQSYPLRITTREENEKSKTTTIALNLGQKLPVSRVVLDCTTKNDYYRPFKIESVVDSFKTEKGWHYRYDLLYRGTINSISDNAFNFNNRLIQKLRITIKNFDDQPLSFGDYLVKGPHYRLITRLDNTEELFLYFGNKNAKSPTYDISFFKDKVPGNPNESILGEMVYLPREYKEASPLFKNKWWLWSIMIFMIVLLGIFTLKMLREEK